MNTHLSNISTLPSFGGTKQKGPAKTFGQYLSGFLAYIADLPRRHRDAAELAKFSDRELTDIGLTRSDLDRIQTPEFAADYHQGRTSALFTLRS
jgi:uncharacterized protein YjiS (DUF1127 family)